MQYGSGIQDACLSICLLRWVANRSTCGLNWNLSYKILNNLWESIHSVLSLKTLDILSVIVFSTPAMWLEEIQKPLFCANSHIYFAISLQIRECMRPILLMYANAVLLSIKIWTCLTLQLCLKYDFRANEIAFSCKTLTWFLSIELHLPPIGVFLSIAPHPCSLAPVWIVQSIGISYNDWFAFFRYFNHQFNSAMGWSVQGHKRSIIFAFLKSKWRDFASL